MVRFSLMSFVALGLCACGDVAAQAPAQTAVEVVSPPVTAQTVAPAAKPLVAAARNRLTKRVVYDGAYMKLDYPGGDVPPTMGVCTDVVIRSYRAAYDFDLQKAVHEDMRSSFSDYPTNWGLTRPDRNIDHRRVPNLERYFTRQGYALPKSRVAADYHPGDLVSWRLDGGAGRGGLPHIGIVSDRTARDGTPLIIHNIGRGPEESDILFAHTITGHFRFTPEM